MPDSEQPASGTPTPAQAKSDAFWTAAELGSGLIELDRAECLELLAAKSVGRIAYVGDTGPRILPVNYILAEDCIIFRTVPDGEIFSRQNDRFAACTVRLSSQASKRSNR